MFRFRFPPAIAAFAFVVVFMSADQASSAPAKAPTPHFLAIQAAPAQAPAGNPADQLPPGDGRDVTVRVCSQCHDVSTFAKKRYTDDHWDSVLDDMVSKGLDASDADMATIRKYLVTYLAAPHDSKAPADSSASPKDDSSSAPKDK